MIAAQIDVVTEAAFPKLMETILDELQTFRDRINGYYDRLLNSARDQKNVALENAMRASLKAPIDLHKSLYF
jgi:hypothetical protein